MNIYSTKTVAQFEDLDERNAMCYNYQTETDVSVISKEAETYKVKRGRFKGLKTKIKIIIVIPELFPYKND